jgi:hypothetical protein
MPCRADCDHLVTLMLRVYGAHWNQIPGFTYSRRGTPTFGCAPGKLLIPIRDAEGTIGGFQCRAIDGQEPKYTWFSHDGLLGTPLHHATRTSSQVLLVTEGPLKADYLARHLPWRVLSYQGVGALAQLDAAIAGMPDLKVAVIANDLDLFTRRGVLHGTKTAYRILRRYLDTYALVWPADGHDGGVAPKGLDDYLAAGGDDLYRVLPRSLFRRCGPFDERGRADFRPEVLAELVDRAESLPHVVRS